MKITLELTPIGHFPNQMKFGEKSDMIRRPHLPISIEDAAALEKLDDDIFCVGEFTNCPTDAVFTYGTSDGGMALIPIKPDCFHKIIKPKTK